MPPCRSRCSSSARPWRAWPSLFAAAGRLLHGCSPLSQIAGHDGEAADAADEERKAKPVRQFVQRHLGHAKRAGQSLAGMMWWLFIFIAYSSAMFAAFALALPHWKSASPLVPCATRAGACRASSSRRGFRVHDSRPFGDRLSALMICRRETPRIRSSSASDQTALLIADPLRGPVVDALAAAERRIGQARVVRVTSVGHVVAHLRRALMAVEVLRCLAAELAFVHIDESFGSTPPGNCNITESGQPA